MYNAAMATAETLKKINEILKGAPSQDVLKTLLGDNVRKDYPSGLVAYDLEPAARVLQPVITPIRNRIPRVKGKGGNAANWKQITSLDTNKNNMFSAFGVKAPVVTYTSVDRAATYKSLAMGDNVAIEQIQQALGLEDAKANMSVRLLENVMILEEQAIISGRNAVLTAPASPTCATAAAGGTIAANTYYVMVRVCTPLAKSTVAANVAAAGTIVSRGIKCAANTAVITAGAASTISASVPVVDGALVYEWFVGTVNDTTTEKLEAITTINSVLLTALAGTGSPIIANNSSDALAFDGILSLGSGTGVFGNFGYSKQLATGVAGTGTTFALSDVDTMLKTMFQLYGADPDGLIMAPQQAMDFTNKCRAAGLIRFIVDNDSSTMGQLTGGSRVTGYINPVTSKEIQIVVDPWWPEGSIMAISYGLPAGVPLGEIRNAFEIKTQLDYYQLEYAVTAPKFEIEVRSLECVAGYFLLGSGIITNIAAG